MCEFRFELHFQEFRVFIKCGKSPAQFQANIQARSQSPAHVSLKTPHPNPIQFLCQPCPAQPQMRSQQQNRKLSFTTPQPQPSHKPLSQPSLSPASPSLGIPKSNDLLEQTQKKKTIFGRESSFFTHTHTSSKDSRPEQSQDPNPIPFL